MSVQKYELRRLLICQIQAPGIFCLMHYDFLYVIKIGIVWASDKKKLNDAYCDGFHFAKISFEMLIEGN